MKLKIDQYALACNTLNKVIQGAMTNSGLESVRKHMPTIVYGFL